MKSYYIIRNKDGAIRTEDGWTQSMSDPKLKVYHVKQGAIKYAINRTDNRGERCHVVDEEGNEVY